MASDLDNLKTRRSNVIAELAGMTSTSSGGQPAHTIHRHNVDHLGYHKMLLEGRKLLNKHNTSLQRSCDDIPAISVSATMNMLRNRRKLMTFNSKGHAATSQ